MANRSRQTFLKRRKEKERAARQKAKEMRRRERALERAAESPRPTGSDRDIEGIVAGPQEPVWKMAGVLTDDEIDEIEAAEEAARQEEAKR